MKMLVKKNKDKENTYSHRQSVCPSPDLEKIPWMPTSTVDCKNKHYSNPIMLNLTLHSNKRLLKMRRSSNFNSKTVDSWQMGHNYDTHTVEAKKIFLCHSR